MHQNTFGSRVLAGPAGGAYALPQVSSPRPSSRKGGLLLSGGREGDGAYFQGNGKEGKGREVTKRERKGMSSPQSKDE